MERPRRRCVVCGKRELSSGGGRCSCGANNWIAIEPSPQELERTRLERLERERATKPRRTPVIVEQIRQRSTAAAAPGFRPAIPSTVLETTPLGATLGAPIGSPFVSPIGDSIEAPFDEHEPELATVIPIQRAPRPPAPLTHKPSGPFVMGSEVGSMVVDDFGGSRLNDLLGGMMRGALLLIVGFAGQGKSTASAELAAYAALHWTSVRAGADRVGRCPIFWLDSDQNDPRLVRKCFVTARQEPVFDRRVATLKTRADEEPPWTFEEALASVPPEARVLVIDSLEKWGRRKLQLQLDIMNQLRRHKAWLKIVISGTNKAGDVSGLSDVERADDATVFAEKEGPNKWTLRFTKCRWSPSDAFLERTAPPPPSEPEPDSEPEPEPAPAPTPPVPVAAPVALAAPVVVPAVVAAVPPVPVLPAVPAMPAVSATVPGLPDEFVPRTPEPNFDPRFIARAAGWPLSRIGAYRARLRLLGCHDDSLKEWNAAVRKARGPIPCDGGDAGPHCGKPAVYRATNKSGYTWYCCSQIHAAHSVGPLEPLKKTSAATNEDDEAEASDEADEPLEEETISDE